MNYGAIIERAARLILRYRYLWLLGFLGGESFGAPTGFPAGFTGPAPRGVPQPGVYYFGPGSPPSPFPFPPVHPLQAGTAVVNPGLVAAIIIGVLLAFLILAVFYLFLGPVATGGLVRAAVEHDGERSFSLGQAWNAGLRTFWRVLGLRVAALAVIAAALVVLGLVGLISFAASGFTSSGFSGLALIVLLFVLVAIVTQVVLTLAVRAVVMDDRNLTDSVASAVALVRRRLGRVALVWVISVAVGIGIAIVLVVALALLAIPFVILGLITYSVGAGIGIPLALGILLAVVVFLVVIGASSAFTSVLWTLAYRRFDGEPAAA